MAANDNVHPDQAAWLARAGELAFLREVRAVVERLDRERKASADHTLTDEYLANSMAELGLPEEEEPGAEQVESAVSAYLATLGWRWVADYSEDSYPPTIYGKLRRV